MKSFLSLCVLGSALAASLVGTAHAQVDRADFNAAFPLDAEGTEGVFAVELTPDIYAALNNSDLSDLAVIDANGFPLALSIERPTRDPLPSPVLTPLGEPVVIRSAVADSQENMALQVVRDADGRLRQLELSTTPVVGEDNAGGGLEWLIDAAPAKDAGYDTLRITPTDGSGDFRALVTVFGSNDLATWIPLTDAQPLLRFNASAQAIERLDLPVGTQTWRYVAIRSAEGTALPAVSAVAALRQPSTGAAPLKSLVLAPVHAAAGSQEFNYPNVGALPVQAMRVIIKEPNGLHAFRIEEIDAAKNTSAYVIDGSAWHFVVGRTSLRSDAQSAYLVSTRSTLKASFARRPSAPEVELLYRPDRLLAVAAGPGPYTLLAGSGRYRNQPTPIEDALSAIRLHRGDAWQPPAAFIGPAQTLSGPAAWTLGPRVDRGRTALWGVLVLGAAAVGFAAWRLLRQPHSTAEPQV
jgi:hypothetical protein